MADQKTPPAARDTDKMIRQLSLVALLMAKKGRRVDARTVRWNVEGYGHDDVSWETFTRNFHRDRDELSRLGIDIKHQRDEFGEGDVYWLPPENYFLPAVDFSREELAALNACLYLLEGQFAYSRLLRLALVGLALGTGNPLDDPDTGSYSVNLLSSGYDESVAVRQKEIENAISRRKTIVFDYHALAKDRVEKRTVDPYGTMVTQGDWYMVGYSHEREDLRVFKLRRIQGKIRMKTRSDHDFEIPADFRIGGFTGLRPWQLGQVQGEAVIEFSPRLGWWAKDNYPRCGAVEMNEDGSARLVTDFSDPDSLCRHVLGFGADARLVAPASLRNRMISALKRIEKDHAQEPPQLPQRVHQSGGAGDRAPDTELAGPQVPPERFSEMTTTISYLIDRLGDSESVMLPAAEVMNDIGFESREAMEQALDLIRLVNFCGGGYIVWPELQGDEVRVEWFPEGEALRQPAHLSPREARAMLLAIDLVGSHLLGGQYGSLNTARRKILQAAGGFDECEAIAVGETEKEDFNICRVINEGLSLHKLVEIEYLAQSDSRPRRRRVEPYLVYQAKGRWYLAAWSLEQNAMRTYRFGMIKSATLLDADFEPRPPETIDIDRYVRDPRFPSGEKAPHSAEVWFKPDPARWVREKQAGVEELQDGSLISHIPYFSEEWLVREILGYGGSAILVAPPEMRQRVAASAASLAREYL